MERKYLLEKKSNPLAEFRSEISELKAVETAKKERGERYDPHFIDIDPALLTDIDREMYVKYRNEALDRKMLEIWRDDIWKSGITSETESRSNFAAWIANRIAVKEAEERIKSRTIP